MSISRRTVLFLGKDGFVYCDPVRNTQATQTFSGSDIKDMEVINEDLLTREISAFIAANSLETAQVTIILEKDLLFEQRYVKEELEKRKDIAIPELEKRLAETTPFDAVSTKVLNIGKDIVIMSTNSAIFQAVKRVFETHGFIVSSVLPIILPEFGEATEASVEGARVILTKTDSLRADNLIDVSNGSRVSFTDAVSDTVPQEKKTNNPTHRKSKRPLVLAGVFLILLLVLLVMIIGMFIGNRG